MAKTISQTIANTETLEPVVSWVRSQSFKALSGGPVQVTLGRPESDRSGEQNSKEHVMMEDIRKTGVLKMPGRRVVMSGYSFDEAKALLVTWFSNEKDQMGEPLAKPVRHVTCPVTGQNISIRPSVTDFGKKVTSEFIEWLYATGNEMAVQWGEPSLAFYEEYRQAQER